MYSLGFASGWEVLLTPFLYRLASPCTLPEYIALYIYQKKKGSNSYRRKLILHITS